MNTGPELTAYIATISHDKRVALKAALSKGHRDLQGNYGRQLERLNGRRFDLSEVSRLWFALDSSDIGKKVDPIVQQVVTLHEVAPILHGGHSMENDGFVRTLRNRAEKALNAGSDRIRQTDKGLWLVEAAHAREVLDL